MDADIPAEEIEDKYQSPLNFHHDLLRPATTPASVAAPTPSLYTANQEFIMRRLNGGRAAAVGTSGSRVVEESKDEISIEEERPKQIVDDTVIQTQSSHLGQLISNEGVIDHSMTH
jgi:hypothetical protein